MRYFPIFFDLNGKQVLVVGGGEVANRKIEMLVRSGAKVTVVSPQIEPYLQSLVDLDKIEHVKSFYRESLLDNDYVQVWATTDSSEINHQVYRDATAAGIMTNVVDDIEFCDFITPSMVNRGQIQVAISSGGASPVLVRYLRELLETQIPQNVALLADFAGNKRSEIKRLLPNVNLRRKFWETFFRTTTVEHATKLQQLEQAYGLHLNQDVGEGASRNWIEIGTDPEMLTLKSLRLMQQAELILYPLGCKEVFVDLCRRDAERYGYKNEEQLIDQIKQSEQKGLRVTVLLKKGQLISSSVLQTYMAQEIFIKTQ
jgi:precorrin-2 dehydrogenase/sirohydrochlorin ferrochelatase